MVFKNLNGTTRSLFSFGKGAVKTFIGAITSPGILQGQDADKRTVRDLVQYNPRWLIPENYSQLATHHELHDLSSGPPMEMEAGSEYIMDEGAVLVDGGATGESQVAGRPVWYLQANNTQIAGAHEVHTFHGAPPLTMEDGSVYSFDAGAVLVL